MAAAAIQFLHRLLLKWANGGEVFDLGNGAWRQRAGGVEGVPRGTGKINGNSNA